MLKAFIILIIIILSLPAQVLAGDFYNLSGRILLQVEENGEAWYVYPDDNRRYYLGRPQEAFDIMRELSLGVTKEFIDSYEVFPNRVQGKILLAVDDVGKAYYISPVTGLKHYLGRPQEAFDIMRVQGLGISNVDLSKIDKGSLEKESKLLSVPFTSQAPFGNWSDQRQQDGCEEASILMAIKWARQESLSLSEAEATILDIADFETANYGSFRDTSAYDSMERIVKGYFDYNQVEVKYDISIEDIVFELNQGNLIIVPANGQLLNNPHFTSPGPDRHMLVIKGYDKNNEEFITNDPGTKRGEGFRYSFANLHDSIRDYPTGDHLPIIGVTKAMIVISR